MKNEKTLRWLIYITGAVCLYLFIAVRSLPLYNLLIKEKLVPGYWDKTKYGECYYFNNIKTFREEGLPEVVTKFQYDSLQAKPEDADLLVFGDSFFDISRGTQFPRLLSEKTDYKIHFVYEELPLTYLHRINYQSKNPKIMILGLVERYIPRKGALINKSSYVQDNRSRFKKLFDAVVNIIFYKRSEELYDVLLKRSYLTGNINCAISTFKFKTFGHISELTPKYLANENDPWLFYYDQVNSENTSFYYKHKVAEIDSISKNISDLASILKSEYNIDLVFLPLPAQYTLCHKVINNDQYNEFLPMLYDSLSRYKVSYINIFEDYKKSNDRLYYGTDGHWNPLGIEIAVNHTIDYLSKNYSDMN